MIAPAGHLCNVRSGHLNATLGGKDMGSMAQTGLLLVPSDALGHIWALPGALGGGRGLTPETGMGNLNTQLFHMRGARNPVFFLLTKVCERHAGTADETPNELTYSVDPGEIPGGDRF